MAMIAKTTKETKIKKDKGVQSAPYFEKGCRRTGVGHAVIFQTSLN